MKALGYDPIKKDGSRLTYNAPYSADRNATMIVDVEKNRWHDSKEPEKYYGGIYKLAYELTGSCNRSELDLYIATQMSLIREVKIRHEPDYAPGYNSMLSSREQPKLEQTKPKTKRRFRF